MHGTLTFRPLFPYQFPSLGGIAPRHFPIRSRELGSGNASSQVEGAWSHLPTELPVLRDSRASILKPPLTSGGWSSSHSFRRLWASAYYFLISAAPSFYVLALWNDRGLWAAAESTG